MGNMKKLYFCDVWLILDNTNHIFFLICLTYIRAGLHIYDCHNKIYLIHQYQYKSLTIVRNEAFVISEADIDIYIYSDTFSPKLVVCHTMKII